MYRHFYANFTYKRWPVSRTMGMPQRQSLSRPTGITQSLLKPRGPEASTIHHERMLAGQLGTFPLLMDFT